MIQPNLNFKTKSIQVFLNQDIDINFSKTEARKITFLEKEIIKILNFYNEESIYLKKAEYCQGTCSFTFKKFVFPYFRKEVKHLTREQTMLFVTQAAYFFGLTACGHIKNWNYSAIKFYENIENEKMGFTDIIIKYKKFVENKVDTALIFKAVNYRKLKDKIFGEINFELEKYCTGTLKFFIES